MITRFRKKDREGDKDTKQREGLKDLASFYRANPHRFLVDYCGMSWLTPIQKILINILVKYTYVAIFASRGFGKSMLSAAALVAKAILYPGIEIVIAAGVRSQSINVIDKIVTKYIPASPNLANEIETHKNTPSDAFILFKNGSIIKVVTARDSARSARANLILVDECVQVKKSVIDSVLKKFKAGERTPGFFNNPKYENYPKEPNAEIYISSATYQTNWTFLKFKTFFKKMVMGENYIAMGFPWQMAVAQGYYPLTQVVEELTEGDYDSIRFSMEMDTLFYGQSSSAFYALSDLEVNRTLEYPVYPPMFYQILGDPKFKYTPKKNGEIRLIGMDVAAMSGGGNDNSAYAVLSLKPNSYSQYDRSLIYIEVINGGHTQDQAIRLRQLYDDYEADYVVVDTNGIGLGIADALFREIVDEERNVIYKPWTCINDPRMAERCIDPDAQPVLYSIKASSQLNNDIAVSFRDCLKRGKIKLLINEIEAKEEWIKNRSYNRLSEEDKAMFQLPYYNTTMLVNETINLSYEINNGKIRVYEPANGRKDRFSAVSYANFIASDLEREILRPSLDTNFLSGFQFKRPEYKKTGW